MRAFLARFSIVVATVLAITGCRGSGGGSPWGFGRKDAAPTMTESGPQLPTASTTPPSYGSSYAAAAQAQGTSAFADPAGGVPNQAAPYPGQPAGYAGAAAGGAPPAAYGANSGMPQQGPYNENYAEQPPAAAPQAYPSTGYPATATPDAYQTPVAATNAPPVADPYTGVPGGGYGAPAAANAGPPAGSYDATTGVYQANDPTTPDYQSADNRYGAAADPYAQPEQAAADSYAASSPTGDPMPDQASTPSNPGDPYRPGSTGYNPGQTGYSPPGVPQYQMAAQTNVVSSNRQDPYYRPGSTSDYAPTTGVQTPAAAATADRYNTPPIGGSDYADPYAQPRGYQATSPAGGMTR